MRTGRPRSGARKVVMQGVSGLLCPFCEELLRWGMNECDCGVYWLGHSMKRYPGCEKDHPLLSTSLFVLGWTGTEWVEPHYRV